MVCRYVLSIKLIAPKGSFEQEGAQRIHQRCEMLTVTAFEIRPSIGSRRQNPIR